MQVFAQPFWAPKGGSPDPEYEDAFWPSKAMEARATSFRFAVADGATETFFSRSWAKRLVRYFCRDSRDLSFSEESFCCLQTRWSKIVKRWCSTTVRKRPLPWYAEQKSQLGAFAAFLGLILVDDSKKDRSDENWKWQAVAIGDSCLVQVRGEEVLARFPLPDSAAFSNRPHLLSSNQAHNKHILEHPPTMNGTGQAGDAFYLMTDALACWFMREQESGRKPWHIIRDLGTRDEPKAFREWVDSLRAKGDLRNDDVTLLRMDIT